MLAITLTINISERQISLLGFLKYFAPELILVAKLSAPTCSTCAFAVPDTTKLPDIISSPGFFLDCVRLAGDKAFVDFDRAFDDDCVRTNLTSA